MDEDRAVAGCLALVGAFVVAAAWHYWGPK